MSSLNPTSTTSAAAQGTPDAPATLSPGIHHITAIASNPQRNLDFYTRTLGLRLVKRTVNFDDPGSYHFYFGDFAGTPGTLLTFFPWPFAKQGKHGAGAVSTTAFLVPVGSLEFWQTRLAALKVPATEIVTRFGERVLPFSDPDGMQLELIESAEAGGIEVTSGSGEAAGSGGAGSSSIPASNAIRGFHGATLLLRNSKDARLILVDALGFTPQGSEGDRTRFVAPSTSPIGRVIDIVEDRGADWGKLGAGIVHHIAVRTASDESQAKLSTRLASLGFRPTPVQDRSYFHSIYLREKGGVLFEVATDAPGFATDEPVTRLGEALQLPQWLESRRPEIEATLPKIEVRTETRP